MSVARPQLRGTEDRIRWHLDAGRQQSAVWLYLMWTYGGQWRRWRHPETLRERMAASAMGFCRKWKLDDHWSQPEAGAVRRAHRYVVDMILHLAHRRFGCPRGWRRTGDREELTMDEAQARLERESRKAAEYSKEVREDVNLDRKHFAEKQKIRAKRLRKRGVSVRGIAETLGVDVRTVRGYLT